MAEKTTPAPQSKHWLTRGVLGIGLASLFSDWGHEAATAILPAFLASLGAPAYALGIIEGVSDGLSSFAKLAGGWIADRPALRKPVGIIGYLAQDFPHSPTPLRTRGQRFSSSARSAGSDAAAVALRATRSSPTPSQPAQKAAPSASSARWTRSVPSSARSPPPR